MEKIKSLADLKKIRDNVHRKSICAKKASILKI